MRTIRHDDSVLTLVGTAGDQDLILDIQLPSEDGAVVVPNGLTKAHATLGVRVVVGGDGGQGFASRVLDPLWRREVHVSLSEVNAISRQIGGTVANNITKSVIARIHRMTQRPPTYLKMDQTS